METSSLEYSQSKYPDASLTFDTLHIEDIKGKESVDGPNWRDLMTPNRSHAFDTISILSSMDPSQILEQLHKVSRISDKSFIGSTSSPIKSFKPNESIPVSCNLSDSNEFLRRKASLDSRESLRQSANNIVELALTGRSNEGLPDKVNPDLLVEVVKKAVKDTKKTPTIEHLIKFVQILKDDDKVLTPKTGDQSLFAELKLKESQNEVLTLNKALSECQAELKVFKEFIVDSIGLFKQECTKWMNEKAEAEPIKEELSKKQEQIMMLQKALQDSESSLNFERKSKTSQRKECKSQTIQTEDQFIKELIDRNEQLKLQVNQNLETFDKFAEKIASYKNIEKAFVEKQNELESIKKDKQELVEAVEQLVASAQKLMESSKGSKEQKLRKVAEMMGSLRISLSDLN